MAALYWNSEVRTLTPGTGSIGALKIVIANELQQSGFSNVRRSELDVSGVKNSVFVSIAHFPIDGTRCWEVVMGSGDDGDVTKNTVEWLADEVRRSCFTL